MLLPWRRVLLVMMTIDDEEAPSSVPKQRISEVANNLITIVYQNKDHPMLKNLLDLSEVNYRQNMGVVVTALLRAAGLAWNASGTLLWRRADPAGAKIKWRAPKSSRSRKPADPRPTTLGGLDDGAHDADAPAAGSAAAQRAAEAARPAAPTALELAKGHPWTDVVSAVRAAAAALDELTIEDVITIVHHFDVYHVEVAVNKEFKTIVERDTKTYELPTDADGGLKLRGGKRGAAAKKAPLPPARHTGLDKELRACYANVELRGKFTSGDIELLGLADGADADAPLVRTKDTKVKKDILVRISPVYASPAPETEKAEGLDAFAVDAFVTIMEAAEEAMEEAEEAAETEEAEMAEATEVMDAEAAEATEATEAATAAEAIEAIEAARARAAKLEAKREKVKALNKARLEAREQLLGAALGLLDTIRHHFFRVAQYAATLKLPTAERIEKAWQFWKQGLLGHVYTRTHHFCCADAECRRPDYKERPELTPLALSPYHPLGGATSPRTWDSPYMLEYWGDRMRALGHEQPRLFELQAP